MTVKLVRSMHRAMAQVNFIDVSLPKEQQVKFTISEFMQKKAKEIREGHRLSETELEALYELCEGGDPTTMLMFNSRIDKERVRKWHPELKQADLEKVASNIQNLMWLDPSEYRYIQAC
jgi:helix-turn-helix protein